jgi:hypothetical protein
MVNVIFVRTRVIARLQQNPLGPYLEQLGVCLAGGQKTTVLFTDFSLPFY